MPSKMYSVWRTLLGGNQEQRKWLLRQVDGKGRFPPHRTGFGILIWMVFLIGIPLNIVLFIANVSIELRGPAAIAWSVIGGILALRHYRWLSRSAEFQALA